MAIDHRILQQIGVRDNAQALNVFQGALASAKNRELATAQEARRAELAPFQLQQAQQQAQAGQSALDEQVANRKIRSIAEFGIKLKPVIQSGNIDQAQTMLANRVVELQSQGLPTTETVEAITALRGGDSQGVLSAIDSIQTIAQQRGLTGTSGAVQSSQFIPGVGFATLDKSGRAKVVSVEGVGETVSEKREADIEKSARIEQQKSKLQGLSAAKKLAVTKSGVAFDKIANIDVALANFDDAIRAIDEGAQTGTIVSKLPSFRRSSIELDNIQKSLGLDVIANTTFGALSESELQFALDKALPKNLAPQDLKVWLQAKKAAQSKLRDHISEAAQFLGTGENTIPDWIELQKAKAVIKQQSEVAQTPELTEQPAIEPAISPSDAVVVQPSAGNEGVPESTNNSNGQIMVDANGNRARVFADGTFEEL